MRVLISACLLGVACRYDGKSRACPEAVRLLENYELIPVCPEQLGGLPTPRLPAEIQKNGRVISRTGDDVTAAYRRGAEETLGLCRLTGCRAAVLKANSPSCGCGQVYDGSFSGVLVPGSGITAQLLKDHGVRVLTEKDLFSAGGAVF